MVDAMVKIAPPGCAPIPEESLSANAHHDSLQPDANLGNLPSIRSGGQESPKGSGTEKDVVSGRQRANSNAAPADQDAVAATQAHQQDIT
mmetsp:Transcript_30413/g.40452  ORF Transcript_30413/g.40452 Transcript_30413/m.40452 type:complete len:90 (+) Transcript_30413:3523-3792(+)